MHTDTKAYGLLLVFAIIGSFATGLLCYHYVIPYFSLEEQTPEIHNHYYLNETNIYTNESHFQFQNISQYFGVEWNITIGHAILTNGSSGFYFFFDTLDSQVIMKYNVVRGYSLYRPQNASLTIYDSKYSEPTAYTKVGYNVSDYVMTDFIFNPNHAIMVVFTFWEMVIESEIITCYVMLQVI